MISLILSLMLSAHAEPGFDKMQHYTLSVIGSEALSVHLHNQGDKHHQRNAALLMIFVGITKEVSDDKFDEGDLLADVLGSLTPLFLRWEF